MELSSETIRQIVGQVTEMIGEKADPVEITKIVGEVIARLTNTPEELSLPTVEEKPIENNPPKKLIINAFGASSGFPSEKIREYVAAKALRITDISVIDIDNFTSFVAIIDFSDYQRELTQVKFDLDKICRDAGFKAIIQDSGYYSNL